MKRLESARTNYASVRSFEVNPPRAERLGFALEADNLQQALYLFDGQLATSYHNTATISFGAKPGVSEYIVLMNKQKDNKPLAMKVTQLDAKGSIVDSREVTGFEIVPVAK